MTCACGFHLNPPNTPCKCDGSQPACIQHDCKHLNTERIDWGTLRCKDCRKMLLNDEGFKKCEPGCKYPWCKDGGMCKIDFEKLKNETRPIKAI